MALKRLNCNVPSDIYDWVDNESKTTGIMKSTIVYVALKTYIDQQKALRMSEMVDAYTKKKEEVEPQ